MKYETPQEYIDDFEAKAQAYIDDYFGNRQEYVRREIERLEQEIHYIDNPQSDSVFIPALDKMIEEIGFEKSINIRKRKIDFLESQKKNLNIELLEGKMFFESDTDLVELAQALCTNGNWTGNRSDLVRLFSFLSKKDDIKDKRRAEDLRERNYPSFTPNLEIAFKKYLDDHNKAKR